ncbi:oligoribonuclease, mitochondrial [Latimeria chalumnae]|uniref:oligoribonuclease, mitochondrial n=1 Tax=Latimeria chalumnae TaxID=7897 RepID=UPI0006D917DA|nr:PREDICTED: oligoribonuclease, mitochondrial [Latimeria chalumnae]|eukprot:XP_005988226.2 PREDICTED: oligoribonuclease, mitochondrial [Latimeria chalumnae]
MRQACRSGGTAALRLACGPPSASARPAPTSPPGRHSGPSSHPRRAAGPRDPRFPALAAGLQPRGGPRCLFVRGPGGGGGGSSIMATAAADSMAFRLVWVDLEMTGLDIERDHIIEMACIITDSDLNVLAEGPSLIINQPDELLDNMSDWCKEHHGKSGLTQAVRESKISLQQAEYEFLSFVRQHTPPGLCPLAGNSVQADKKFLEKYMPQFMRHLHYRIIDVSTIKELSRRWYPEEYEAAPKKKASHRALDDIQESIKELQFYRKSIFKKTDKKRKILENGENVANES